jgi:hypothetical protein
MKYVYCLRNKHRPRLHFKRELLPPATQYYRKQGLKLIGGGEWKSALCPFHKETRPSFRVRVESGGFLCMKCRVHGGDVLAFHMQRYGLGFREAAKQLGAWKEAGQ